MGYDPKQKYELTKLLPAAEAGDPEAMLLVAEIAAVEGYSDLEVQQLADFTWSRLLSLRHLLYNRVHNTFPCGGR